MREGNKMKRLLKTLMLGAALAASGSAAALAAEAQPLRVCADPDNLPFSSAAAATPGLYVELGAMLAHALGRPFEPVWSVSYFGKHTVRTTLLAGACDAYVGLPDDPDFMRRQMLVSKPFLHIGYAVMAPAGMPVGRLDDLAGKRVAVQFSTPPQSLLAERDDAHAVTFMSPEEAARALARHEVDAAFIWGPSAGFFNATVLRGAYQVVPVAGEGMQWQVVIGFARTNAALRDAVDAARASNAAAVAALAAKYGLPQAEPVRLTQAGRVMLVADTAPAPAGAGDPAKIAAGREVFNGTCSHCHGPDAVQSVRRIDLRLLQHRYSDKMDDVFLFTVTHGRPAKGMPNWSSVFSDQDFRNILAYLHTIQTPE